MNYNTNFKIELKNNFKDKNVSDTSTHLYLRNLEKLNDNLPLKNLNFLNNVDDILNKLKDYKPNTYRSYLISICSSLKFDKSKKNIKLYDKYYKLLDEVNKDLKLKEKQQLKSDTQKENWITWNEVENVYKNLEKEVNTFKNLKQLNLHKYNILLDYVVLSLYYFIPPKRNQDWTLMNLIYKNNNVLSIDKNYLDYSDEKFIFNKYKTSKTKGILTEDIPTELMKIFDLYFKYHPLLKNKKINKNTNVPLLVYNNGNPLSSVNSITRILNKIFNKKIGSSMLRHIYLSSKYATNITEMKKDADIMGHSIDTQINNYIKN